MKFSKLESSFHLAASKGFKQPTLRSNGLRFKLAGPTSVNQGAVYVTRADNGTYLGKIFNGAMRFAGVSTAEQRQLFPIIHDICENPDAAAVRYGKETGNCAICSRPLSNKYSLELGIGPICAAKMGWIELPPKQDLFDILNQL